MVQSAIFPMLNACSRKQCCKALADFELFVSFRFQVLYCICSKIETSEFLHFVGHKASKFQARNSTYFLLEWIIFTKLDQKLSVLMKRVWMSLQILRHHGHTDDINKQGNGRRNHC